MRRELSFHVLLCIFSSVLLSLSPFSSSSLSSVPQEEIISRFQKYLQINTAHPNPNYREAADFILSEASSLSLDSQTLEFVPGKPLVLLKWAGSDSTLPSILLNSHTDVVPAEQSKWAHHPFSAHVDEAGRIYARGSQDMKCVGIQYLEAIRQLKASGFEPTRTVYLSFVPDEEIGGHDGAELFAKSDVFKSLNVGIVLDEGLASPTENYRAFYAERCPWWLIIKATGAPGHGAKLYDNTAMENILKSIESVRRFRAAQFVLVKAGLKAEGEIISINMAFLKAGTPSPTGFVMNLQPSEAEAGFDIRVPLTANEDSLEKRIAEEWAPSSRNMTFRVLFFHYGNGTAEGFSGSDKVLTTSLHKCAVLSTLGGLSTVGRLTSDTLDMLICAKSQLKKLLKLMNSCGLIEDPSPIACATRKLIIGHTEGLLSYKAFSNLIASSSCRFSNGDIDLHLLDLLKIYLVSMKKGHCKKCTSHISCHMDQEDKDGE